MYVNINTLPQRGNVFDNDLADSRRLLFLESSLNARGNVGHVSWQSRWRVTNVMQARPTTRWLTARRYTTVTSSRRSRIFWVLYPSWGTRRNPSLRSWQRSKSSTRTHLHLVEKHHIVRVLFVNVLFIVIRRVFSYNSYAVLSLDRVAGKGREVYHQVLQLEGTWRFGPASPRI